MQPPLTLLHAESSLSETKIERFSQLTDEELVKSLKPGQAGSLKTVLRDRGFDVDSLPREILAKEVPRA
jgi:hypothetical protein